jgi:hypothetical protein
MMDYSIGHELLLLHERNALIVPDDSATDETYRFAILRAVMICSRSWEENQRPMRWRRVWSWLARRCDLAAAIQAFREYRLAGVSMPEVKPIPGEKGRALGGPHLARVLEFAMRLRGQEAFDMPFGLAQWLYYCGAESEGACMMLSDEEREMESAKDALIAEIRKEKEAKWPA